METRRAVESSWGLRRILSKIYDSRFFRRVIAPRLSDRRRLALATVLLQGVRGALDVRDESWPSRVTVGHGREDTRWPYQERWVGFEIAPGERVLDIGSGNNPFPKATHLADMYGSDNKHRGGQDIALLRDQRPLVFCDVEALPFRDGAFDFVYCSHVLEHVDDPVRACREIVRVGRRGYLETPTRVSDVMFNFTRIRHHKWHVSAVGGTLVFMQYMEHEYRDMGTNAFFVQFHSRFGSPFQELVHRNRDL
ncbi:class I SAM-dependent methyltransferase, partial [bacterium]|nr:class I SAM-dependent methyltransferase [bacterium]